ncbi:4-(cytidine 5'-diphospho)-2-C-methyl-D-erythritol kinase [Pseudofrankia inefficax]|uniref:4-diphosphocytidyl-2-C-methyl-D-erythritol kinase n=1 Tax=Pseudofrankia inefficax (strain DSM 45817 / CECT 9037 / DDB 130130 / EuI1c) TaxID=298654 RepID=E3JCK4_PSEI1|nr:4-(cytidine 5'-diphospho)-2-C-methyl-D-erythritol kinase [Pseudofrankia inefficax]ADP78700.1 4-diphosphocytidyl-2C-methyl-D-erythritol kinase [Pseudofrankia inefficax]
MSTELSTGSTLSPESSPSRVTVRAPAKVNLHLGVGPRRADGFHEVITVLQAVGLYDELTVTDLEPTDGSDDGPAVTATVEISGEGAVGPAGDPAVVPTNADNLAVRAALLVAETAGLRGRRIHLEMAKGIPVAAGMAGGSADGAAALVACDALWGTGLPVQTLAELAARLGSDVPFPLTGGTALGVGRGEQLSLVATAGEYHWVFALADGGLSTPSVYREFDSGATEGRTADGRTAPTPADAVLTAVATGDPAVLGAALCNDLQAPAIRLRPSLGDVLAEGRALGALGALVSGSGPTTAFLARDAAHGAELAAGLAASGLARAVRQASAPAPGATVL